VVCHCINKILKLEIVWLFTYFNLDLTLALLFVYSGDNFLSLYCYSYLFCITNYNYLECMHEHFLMFRNYI